MGISLFEGPKGRRVSPGASSTTSTLVSRIISPDLLVSRETFATPSDTEWDEYLALLGTLDDLQNVRVLVVTDGGGPNAPQRKRLQALLAGRPMRVAICSDSAKTRFITSAISLFNPHHRGFSKSEIAEAFAHLGMTVDECRLVQVALAQLERLL